MTLPDYDGGSIVNLMASIAQGFSATAGPCPGPYPALRLLNQAPLPADGHVVLMVIDGLGYNYLRQATGVSVLQRGLLGAMTSVFPSTTATAVTAFLTGVPAQQHGLTGWHLHLEEIDQSVAILPFETRAGALPLRGLGVDPARLFDYPTFFQGIDAESFAVSPHSIANSLFNRAHTRAAGVEPYSSLTQCLEAVERLTRPQQRRRFLYVYLPDFDSTAHAYGVGSPLAAALLRRFSDALERLLRSLAGRGTTIVLAADHGFIDVPPAQRLELEDHPGLVDCLAGPLTGERRLPYCRVKPAHHRQFERYVAEHLHHACVAVPSATLIEQHYFGLGTAHAALASRVGDYALIMHPGYTLKDWLPDEKRHTLIGVHGGVTEDEMLVPLVVLRP